MENIGPICCATDDDYDDCLYIYYCIPYICNVYDIAVVYNIIIYEIEKSYTILLYFYILIHTSI